MSGPNKGIDQMNMNLLNLELFSFETRDIVTSYDENQKVIGQSVQSNKGTVSYGVATGEVRVDNPDGTGFTLMVNPLLTNKLLEWVQSNIRKADEQEAHRRQQQNEEHEERMKSLQAETERNKLRLEEEKLRHEIKMVELKIELAEKKKELADIEDGDQNDGIIGDGQGES